jgi:predicted nicotinamide N-methyase
MAGWLRAMAARGALVLTGDLGRSHLPASGLVELARYSVPTSLDLEDTDSKLVRVLRFVAD